MSMGVRIQNAFDYFNHASRQVVKVVYWSISQNAENDPRPQTSHKAVMDILIHIVLDFVIVTKIILL